MEDRLARPSSWRPAVRQNLCADLRQWAIDRYRRKRRWGRESGTVSGPLSVVSCSNGRRTTDNGHPLVLVEQVATRQVIRAASREAMAHGICCEMTLAEACALCPN